MGERRALEALPREARRVAAKPGRAKGWSRSRSIDASVPPSRPAAGLPHQVGRTLTRVSPPRRRGSTGKAGEGERIQPITYKEAASPPLRCRCLPVAEQLREPDVADVAQTAVVGRHRHVEALGHPLGAAPGGGGGSRENPAPVG